MSISAAELVIKFNKLNNIDLTNALTKSAALVEATAKENLIRSGRDSEGEVARSVAFTVDSNSAEIYTPLEKGFWLEFGTGAYAEHNDGRPGWWVWVDPECNAPKSTTRIIYDYTGACQCASSLSRLYGSSHVHVTQGEPAVRFLRNALETNVDAIKAILNEAIMEGL